MFQLIYELRKNWRGWTGRVDGTGIEGSIKGPRGLKTVINYNYNAMCLMDCLHVLAKMWLLLIIILVLMIG